MKEHGFKIIVGAVIILVVVLLVFASKDKETESGLSKAQLDEFAQCIADSGATYYGAFWCPNCQNQSAKFKNSKNLPYVECSTPSKGQTQECTDAGITGYPTWEFADGSRLSGDLPLETLAEQTGCQLPGADINNLDEETEEAEMEVTELETPSEE